MKKEKKKNQIMRLKTHILSLLLATAGLAGCSSDSTLTDIPDIVEQEPLAFSVATSDGGGTPLSRASQPLEEGFLVSTYKLYGTAEQQTVMDRYEASYNKTTYEGSKWNTVGEKDAAPDNLYKTQYERYWDLSAFPYRFHAITPCPKTVDNNLITGFKLTDTELAIPETAAIYECQTCADGTVTPATIAGTDDPYMIAQVQRDADGRDWDMLQPQFDAEGNVTAVKTEINYGFGYGLTRKVPLAFHHTTSKVRFAIFADVPTFPDEPLTIKNVTITARRADALGRGEFVKVGRGFSSSLDGVGESFFDNGAFGDVNTAEEVTLLKNTMVTYDLRSANSRANAYFFHLPNTGDDAMPDGTPGGLLQIPQKGVKLFVEFDINNEHYSFQFEIKRSDGTVQQEFDWRASCRYTYDIVVKHLKPFEIAFTATLEPWVTVRSGEIGTDLEQ